MFPWFSKTFKYGSRIIAGMWGVLGLALSAQAVIPIPGGSSGQAGATGWQHTGVTLHSCPSGVLDGSVTPLVVDGCSFTGPITIRGTVTLKRSKVVCSDLAGITIEGAAGPVLIEDVEITTSDPNAVGGAARMDRTINIWKSNVTLNRLWTHDTMRGLDFTGENHITLLDSYLGPNVSPPPGEPPGSCINDVERPHSSAIRAAGGTYAIKLSNTVLHIGACSRASGLIATYDENGANHGWEVAGGRWIIDDTNGGYGIAAGYTVGASAGNSDFNIHDLQISTQVNPEGCPQGCAQNWDDSASCNRSVAGSVCGLNSPKIWCNITKYNPGHPENGQLGWGLNPRPLRHTLRPPTATRSARAVTLRGTVILPEGTSVVPTGTPVLVALGNSTSSLIPK